MHPLLSCSRFACVMACPAEVPPAEAVEVAPSDTDTEAYWAELILKHEAEISKLKLQMSAVSVQLAFARRRHRQKVLSRCVEALGIIPPTDKADLLKPIESSPEVGAAAAEVPLRGRPSLKPPQTTAQLQSGPASRHQ